MQGTEAEARHLALIAESEQLLDESVAARQTSWVAENLLNAADRAAMCERRRRNWTRLGSILSSVVGWGGVFRPLYVSLEADAVPLVFPLLVKDHHRNQLRTHLASCRIFCPIHWSLMIQRP